MTVITTIISKDCTVHATDSLVSLLEDGATTPDNFESKIHRVEKFRGAISTCGLSQYGGWTARLWLSLKIGEVDEFEESSEFAAFLCQKLNEETNDMKFDKEQPFGILMHFSAYEKFGNNENESRIPELYLISNYEDTEYGVKDKVHWSRETYIHCPGRDVSISPGDFLAQAFVDLMLHEGNWLIFNNGDPKMFNPMANSIIKSYRELEERGDLDEENPVSSLRNLATCAVDMVSLAQSKLCKPGSQLVGGETHNIAITPHGHYSSDTED